MTLSKEMFEGHLAKAGTRPDLVELEYLISKYPDKIQVYFKTAMHMEDTESCMVTLPCRNKGKKLMVVIAEL